MYSEQQLEVILEKVLGFAERGETREAVRQLQIVEKDAFIECTKIAANTLPSSHPVITNLRAAMAKLPC